MKTCNQCKKAKALLEFTKDKLQADGIDRRCKQCKAGNYAKLDKTERKVWRRQHYEKNLAKELALCAIYREANREVRNAYIKEYYKKFPWKGAAKTAKYRSSKLQATPKWLTADQFKEMEVFYQNCPKGFHVDHIIPLQGKEVSGLHVPWNLQILPAKVNQRKSNRIDYQERSTPSLALDENVR